MFHLNLVFNTFNGIGEMKNVCPFIISVQLLLHKVDLRGHLLSANLGFGWHPNAAPPVYARSGTHRPELRAGCSAACRCIRRACCRPEKVAYT